MKMRKVRERERGQRIREEGGERVRVREGEEGGRKRGERGEREGRGRGREREGEHKPLLEKEIERREKQKFCEGVKENSCAATQGRTERSRRRCGDFLA